MSPRGVTVSCTGTSIDLVLEPHRFLAYVDLLGTTYKAPSLATGYGNHIAQPLLRRALERAGSEQDGWKNLEEAEARKIVESAMKVLFYRDARSLNKVGSWQRNDLPIAAEP